MPGCVAITIGDVTGVGPEVTLKALAAELAADDCRYVLFGDAKLLRQLNSRLSLGLSLDAPRITLVNSLPAPIPFDLRAGAPEAAMAALAWLRAGAEHCLGAKADALVTAPVNKEAIIRA